MKVVFVVNKPGDWPFDTAGVTVTSASHYLNDPAFLEGRDIRVFNLCSSYRYQGRGYYVSMVAEARGHRPLPEVAAIEALHLDGDKDSLHRRLADMFQPAPADRNADFVDLNIFFGRYMPKQNLEQKASLESRHVDHSHYARLAEQLFNLLRLPLMHVRFIRSGRSWHAIDWRPLRLSEIAHEQKHLLAQAAADCTKAHSARLREPAARIPTLAILHTTTDAAQPSNPAAIHKFREAAESLGMHAEVIGQHDAVRIAEFDALFIRDTTHVRNATYKLARRAADAGLVVMDDPDSILRCNNKIYMHELLQRHGLPTPRAMLVERNNIDRIIPLLGLPCVLKQPDGAFSLGVERMETAEQLHARANDMLESSALILAQQYLPTEFDWRIGIIDHRPLFACRYFMAPGHWQIIKHTGRQQSGEGMAEAVAIDATPPRVIDIALRAANLIGGGFYGVDIKQRGESCYIIEVNDNPNVDVDNEDGVLKDALYREVMSVLRQRIELRKEHWR